MVKEIGIDAGGTLTKLAYIDEHEQLILKHYPSYKMAEVVAFVEQFKDIAVIGITGGRAEQFKELMSKPYNINYVVEFEATLLGVRHLLKKENHHFDQAIITNIGSGTSIHYMRGNTSFRAGGTGVGGGTLIGLGALLTGMYNYDDISESASRGNRKSIDLLVEDIFQGLEIPAPLSPEQTASNFGKIGIKKPQQHSNDNMLASVARLVGEVITTLSIQLSEQHEADVIIYIGTTLTDHDVLKDVIEEYTILKKKTPVFLNDHGFSGAVGALKSLDQ
ncbi:type II pantothenate kinase [Kurthia sibirica]|uniref:Type II pantothenate kinase n=1 Tax=Kurthia sibirica TaxID=202750 RepID=A0A2U3APM4_9BACL|nr:type II pantothenate kinase [Kurthia sibirica]PWI26469.1 type II pantothenate kinase [Kurthia sibirica]GEK33037.1 type II pantothenate kinase [Kurthia sibirica]